MMQSVIKELHNDVFYAPYSAFLILYGKRLRCDKNVSFENYICRFTCINVDGKIYCNNEDFRFNKYKNAIINGELGMKEFTMMPDAVVMEGNVLKNRYGYND